MVLHKFAKVPWLKLRRDDSVLDSDLRIEALSTRPMAIEEIDSEEERQTRLRKKKEALGMDETMEIQKSHASASSGARCSTDQIPPPVETSMAQRSTPDLVLCSDELGGVLEPAQEDTKARQERSHRPECSGEGHARAHPHEFPKPVQPLRVERHFRV